MPSELASFLAGGSAFPLSRFLLTLRADALSNFPVISGVLAAKRADFSAESRGGLSGNEKRALILLGDRRLSEIHR
jgi:hypothetical protein